MRIGRRLLDRLEGHRGCFWPTPQGPQLALIGSATEHSALTGATAIRIQGMASRQIVKESERNESVERKDHSKL